MSDVIEWSDPPPPSNTNNFGGPGRRFLFVEALKERPNEWAEYLPKPGAQGWTAAVGGTMRKDYPGVEAISRTAGKDRHGKPYYRVWARWVGTDD